MKPRVQVSLRLSFFDGEYMPVLWKRADDENLPVLLNTPSLFMCLPKAWQKYGENMPVLYVIQTRLSFWQFFLLIRSNLPVLACGQNMPVLCKSADKTCLSFGKHVGIRNHALSVGSNLSRTYELPGFNLTLV